MTKENKLLRESIAQWEEYYKQSILQDSRNLGLRVSPEGACPVCEEFAPDDKLIECLGCPVMEASEMAHCDGTPFAEYPPTLGRIEREIIFLKSLVTAE